MRHFVIVPSDRRFVKRVCYLLSELKFLPLLRLLIHGQYSIILSIAAVYIFRPGWRILSFMRAVETDRYNLFLFVMIRAMGLHLIVLVLTRNSYFVFLGIDT